jgi:hypothetical protein
MTMTAQPVYQQLSTTLRAAVAVTALIDFLIFWSHERAR